MMDRNERRLDLRGLIDEAEAVAEEALEELLEARPELRERYDERSLRLTRQDFAHHARYLAAAALSPDGGSLQDYIAWLKALFDGLGLRDEVILFSFRILGQVAAQRLEPDSATRFISAISTAIETYPRAGGAENRYLQGFLDERPTARAYLDALLAGRRDLALSVAQSFFGEDESVRRLYRELFAPVQRELGRLWQLGKISVAQEHFSTAATQHIMSSFYDRIFAGARLNGRRVLAACAQGELHEIGLRMVADILQTEGWDTRYLGADLPVSELAGEARRTRPDLIALSATIPANVYWLGDAIRAVRRELGEGVRILVGGSPFQSSPGLWRSIGADGTAADFEAAADEAGKLLERAG